LIAAGKATQPLENGSNGPIELVHRIERVIASDDDIADALAELHQSTFLNSAPVPEFDQTH
jgi:hypothetical protein